MSQFFSALLAAIAPTATGIVICVVIAIVAILYQSFAQRLPLAVQKQVSDLAGTVVQAIEQKYSQVGPDGAQKKQEALTLLQSICHSLKLPLNDTHASLAIEAAVYAMNLYQKFQTHLSNEETSPKEIK